MITVTNYIKAKSLDEAYELNQKPNSKIMGGMMWLRLGRNRINNLIDLNDLGLDYVKETDEEFLIGAYTSLRTLETHESLNEYTDNAVNEATRHIVGTQFRNMATVGGTIFGRYGFSDVLTVFMALDSYVRLHKAGVVSLSDFVNMKYDNDILVELIVKKKPVKVVYQSVRNTVTDFPTLTCAVSEIDGKKCVVLGARPKKAQYVVDEDNVLETLNEENIKRFAKYAADTVQTESNMRGSKEYRSHLVKVLVTRCLTQLMEER